MLSTHTSADASTSTDSCLFGLPSEMELEVVWAGQRRTFTVVEFSAQELVVVDFELDITELDLRHHEATLHFCDGEVLDEVACKVSLRRLEAEGVARLRIVADELERLDASRLVALIRSRLVAHEQLQQTRVAIACGWL